MLQRVLFVCIKVLQPIQPIGVMSSAVSLPNYTSTGPAIILDSEKIGRYRWNSTVTRNTVVPGKGYGPGNMKLQHKRTLLQKQNKQAKKGVGAGLGGVGVAQHKYGFVLRFYSTFNQLGSCRVRSVYLITLLLDQPLF